jgi:hypothetical protein
MSNVLIVAFAASFILALLEPITSFISIFITPKAVNAFFSVSLSYLGLYLIGGGSVKHLIIESLAASFLARTALTIAERASTYRWASIKQS